MGFRTILVLAFIVPGLIAGTGSVTLGQGCLDDQALVQAPAWSGTSPVAAIYDTRRHMVVVFDGTPGSISSRTWEWNGERLVASSATGPAGRTNFAMTYDSVRQVTVLVGGTSQSNTNLADTWEYDGNVWVQRLATGSPAGPSSMCFDPVRSRSILVNRTQQTWEWDGQTWVRSADSPFSSRALFYVGYRGVCELIAAPHVARYDGFSWTVSSAVGGPAPRSSPWQDPATSLIYGLDMLDRIIVFDGFAWHPVRSAESPSPLAHMEGLHPVLDPDSSQVLFFGGSDLTITDARNSLCGVWALDGEAWIDRRTPFDRYNHASWIDPGTGRFTIFGGSSGPDAVLGDTFELGESGVWRPVASASAPSARRGCAVGVDALRQEVILFGGGGINVPIPASVSDQTWRFAQGQWTLLNPVTRPTARRGAGMAFDSHRGRMVLFGGYDGSQQLADTWEWDGSSWTQIAAAGPSRRWYPAMAYDPAHHRTVLFGGEALDYLADTWFWDGARWTQQPTRAPLPRSRSGARLAYDQRRAVLLLTGGDFPYASSYPQDLWELTGAGWFQRSTDLRFPVGFQPSFIYEPSSDRFIVFGGSTRAVADVHRLALPYPRVDDPEGPTRLLVGQDAVFTIPEPEPGVLVQWRRGTAALSDSPRIAGARSPTLRISGLTFADRGAYSVVFANSCGAAYSGAVNLDVFCPADYDLSGSVNADDLSDFVTDFFSEPASIRADFDHDGQVTPDDLGEFIRAYFSACAGI